MSKRLCAPCANVQGAHNWILRTRSTILAFAAVVGAIGPVLITLGKLAQGVGSIISLGGTIAGKIPALTKGIKALWGVISANPFMDMEPYTEFLQFIAKRPITLAYKPKNAWYFTSVRISVMEKEEITPVDEYAETDVDFYRLGPWYSTLRAEPYGGDTQRPKRYDYTYPYCYVDSTAPGILIIVRALTLYNVAVTVELRPQEKEIAATVAKVSSSGRVIEADLPNVIEKNVYLMDTYGSLNKATYINKDDPAQRAVYYLDGETGEPTETPKSRITPVFFKVEYIEGAEDFALEAEQRAREDLTPEDFDNLIEITVHDGDKLIPPEKIRIGEIVTIKANGQSCMAKTTFHLQ